VTIFLGKKYYQYSTGSGLSELAKKIFYPFKNKIIFDFGLFVATKKGRTTDFFTPLLFCCCRWIRDKNPGSATLDGTWVPYIANECCFLHLFIA
jgi:hypothetical protein